MKRRRPEVVVKSHSRIERETALKWMQHAIDSLKEHERTGKFDWMLRAQNYADEALEHAALAKDGGKLVGRIERLMEKRDPMRRRRKRKGA